MLVDKTTLSDLSIFESEEELSVFHHLNNTHTNLGRDYLWHILNHPLPNVLAIHDTQNLIKHIQSIAVKWPKHITNGTIMVIEKFYDTPINLYPKKKNEIESFFYKIFNKLDYSLSKYSVEHTISFINGMHQLANILQHSDSKKLQKWVDTIFEKLNHQLVQQMLKLDAKSNLKPHQILKYAHFFRHNFKHEINELIDWYSQLDAYLSLAFVCTKNEYAFPVLQQSETPFIDAKKMYHPLLRNPVSYNVQLMKEKNFLFLTGANMAGKSTFIKTVGVSVYLAHIGMGVPAQNMQLSFFDGLLSNIHVSDNIMKGESYFFNEVHRIKSTIEKISDGKNWLILIDELFKGTNIQDAMKCSSTVIDGFCKMNNALFVLSTHLYEIATDLQKHKNVQFKYFETSVHNNQLLFSYELKDGISNDRLGYLILQREGVVQLLNNL
jgi:DNA mismatch repair ATPase MutS